MPLNSSEGHRSPAPRESWSRSHSLAELLCPPPPHTRGSLERCPGHALCKQALSGKHLRGEGEGESQLLSTGLRQALRRRPVHDLTALLRKRGRCATRSPFSDKKAKAQNGRATWPRSHGTQMTKVGPAPGELGCQSESVSRTPRGSLMLMVCCVRSDRIKFNEDTDRRSHIDRRLADP